MENVHTLSKFPSLFLLALVWVLSAISCQEQNVKSYIEFFPQNLTKIIEGTFHQVEWQSNIKGIHHVGADVEDKKVGEVVSSTLTLYETIDDGGNVTSSGTMNISAKFVGFNRVLLTLFDQHNNSLGEGSFGMSVLLSYLKLNNIFTISIGVLVALVYVNMGATLQLDVVKQIVKRPFGPALGIFCQYVIMPSIGFTLGRIFFPNNPLLALGIFLHGCTPGGGASNMWTHLLGGSLDLSIMMTFMSTVCAFGTLPLWILTVGNTIIADINFVIPFKRIAILIASLIGPCFVGFLLQIYLPRLARLLKFALTPFTIFNIIFVFTFGVYSYRYIFQIFTYKIAIAGFCLPLFGYLSGLFLAILFKRSKKDVIAIGIETGIQNGAIAVLILKLSLDTPAGDLTCVVPAFAAMGTPVPLLIVFIIKTLRNIILRKGSKELPQPGVITEDLGPKSKDDCSEEVYRSTSQCQNQMETSFEVTDVAKTINTAKNETKGLDGIENSAANIKDET